MARLAVLLRILLLKSKVSPGQLSLWDEGQHPRGHQGSPQGGKFAAKMPDGVKPFRASYPIHDIAENASRVHPDAGRSLNDIASKHGTGLADHALERAFNNRILSRPSDRSPIRPEEVDAAHAANLKMPGQTLPSNDLHRVIRESLNRRKSDPFGRRDSAGDKPPARQMSGGPKIDTTSPDAKRVISQLPDNHPMRSGDVPKDDQVGGGIHPAANRADLVHPAAKQRLDGIASEHGSESARQALDCAFRNRVASNGREDAFKGGPVDRSEIGRAHIQNKRLYGPSGASKSEGHLQYTQSSLDRFHAGRP